jgi:hypothetical protein
MDESHVVVAPDTRLNLGVMTCEELNGWHQELTDMKFA